MKNIRLVVGVMAVLSAGAVAVWMCTQRPKERIPATDERKIYWGDGIISPNQDKDLPQCAHLPNYNPTKAESNELARVFLEITDAYTNAPLSVLREKFAMMPDIITNVIDSVYIGTRRPLYIPFGRGFVFDHEIRDFSDVHEFTDFVERNVAMVMFLGDIEVRRGSYSGYLVRLERCVLKIFAAYHEKFRNEGKSELAVMADRFVREWCEHIESEISFTRSYARFQVALQMSGGKTREQANGFARRVTWGKGASYTPKWLDEEFPETSNDDAAAR